MRKSKKTKSGEISKKTLKMMDKSMKSLAKGKVGKPVDLKEIFTKG